MINTSERVGIFPLEVVKPPKGLHVAMEGLAREVLKHNPSDIYKFAADYFEKLINLRKEFSLNGKSIGIQQIVKASLLNSSENFSEKYMVYYSAAEEANEQNEAKERIKRSISNLEEDKIPVSTKTEDVSKRVLSSKSSISPVKEVSEVLDVEKSADSGSNENMLELIENSQSQIEESKNTEDVIDLEKDTDQDIVFIDNNEIVEEPFAIHDRNWIAIGGEINNIPITINSVEEVVEESNNEVTVNEKELKKVETSLIVGKITETDDSEEKDINAENIYENDFVPEMTDCEIISKEGITNKVTDTVVAPIVEESIIVQRVSPLRYEIVTEEQLENYTKSTENDDKIMEHNGTEKFQIDESLSTNDEQTTDLESETKENPILTETKVDITESVNPEEKTDNIISEETLKENVNDSDNEKDEDQNEIIEKDKNKNISIEDSQKKEMKSDETEGKEKCGENADKIEELPCDDNETRENNYNHGDEIDDTLESKPSKIKDDDDAVIIENLELLDRISNNVDSINHNKNIDNENEEGLENISDKVVQREDMTDNESNDKHESVEIAHSDIYEDGKEQVAGNREEVETINNTESKKEKVNEVDGILSQTSEIENKITEVHKDGIELTEEASDKENISDRPEINEYTEHSETKSKDFEDVEDCSDLPPTGDAQNSLTDEDNNSVRVHSDQENSVSINQTEVLEEIVSLNIIDQIPVENTTSDNNVSQSDIEMNIAEESEQLLDINSQVGNIDIDFLDVEKEILEQIIEETDNQNVEISTTTVKNECENIESENNTNCDEVEPLIVKKTISSPLNYEYQIQLENDGNTELENIVESPNRNKIDEHGNEIVKIPEANEEVEEGNAVDPNVGLTNEVYRSENDVDVEPIKASKDFEINETDEKNAIECHNVIINDTDTASQVEIQDISSTEIENIRKQIENETENTSIDLIHFQKTTDGGDVEPDENEDSTPRDKNEDQYISDDTVTKKETIVLNEQVNVDLTARDANEGNKNLQSDIQKDEQLSERREDKNKVDSKEQKDSVTDLEKLSSDHIDKNAIHRSDEMENNEENVSLIESDVITQNEDVIKNQLDQSVSELVNLGSDKNSYVTIEEDNESDKNVNNTHDENNISPRFHESLEEHASNIINEKEDINKEEENNITQQSEIINENQQAPNLCEESKEQQYEGKSDDNKIKSEEISELENILEIEKVSTTNDDELSNPENIINNTVNDPMNSAFDERDSVVESENLILDIKNEQKDEENMSKNIPVENLDQVVNDNSISTNNCENVVELSITEQPKTLLGEQIEGITNIKNSEESRIIIEETVEKVHSTISDLGEEINDSEITEGTFVNKNDEDLTEQSTLSVYELTTEIDLAKTTEHTESIIKEPILTLTEGSAVVDNDLLENDNTQKSEESNIIVDEAHNKEIGDDSEEKTKNEINPDNGESILDKVLDSGTTFIDVRNTLENSNMTISAMELSPDDNSVSHNDDGDLNIKLINAEHADVEINTPSDEEFALHLTTENTSENINEPVDPIEAAHVHDEIGNFENTEEVVEVVSKKQIATLSERNFDTLTPIAETVINDEHSGKSSNDENIDDVGLTNMEQIVEDFIALEKFHTELVNSSLLLSPNTELSKDSEKDITDEFEKETPEKITFENVTSDHVEGFNIDKDSIVIQDIVSLNNFENNKIILILHAEINDNITKAKKAKRSISLQEHDRSENLLVSGPSVDDLILNKLTDEYHKYHDSVIANSTKKVDANLNDNEVKTDIAEQNNIDENIQVNFVNTLETIPPLMDDKITDNDENLFDLTEDLVSSSELSPSSDSQQGNTTANNKSDQSIFEKASVVIQKVFRGFRVRKKIKIEENTISHENIEESIFEKIEEPILEVYTDSESINTDLKRRLNVLLRSTSYHSPIDSKLYTVSEERNVSSTDDESSTFSSAATKIQAGVRGFLTRKCFQRNKTGNSSDTTAPSIGEDSRSIEEYGTTSDLKSSTDDSISKIVVATSTILMEQLEQFDKIDSSQPAIPDINLTEVQKEPNEEVLDRASQNRKRLRREDAIQLHSPFSSGETPVHKQPSKISEEDEQISELAQSIITEIESDNYTPVVRITQNEQNLSPERAQVNLEVSDEETRSDSDKGLEMEESHDHFQLTENENEEYSDAEMPIYHETVKIPRMPTEFNDSSNSDSNELVSPNVEQKRIQRKLPRYVSADVETLVSKHKEDADETDGVEEEQQEEENIDVEIKGNVNNDDNIDVEDEKVVKILHSSEFHDTLVLPTKIIRKDAVQKDDSPLQL